MERAITDFKGRFLGVLSLPDDTPEEVWTEKLLSYQSENTEVYKAASVKERKEWADGLIERFKHRNINEWHINIFQALWMQHRMRALEINFQGLPLVIDMLNLVISGDIEVACVALQLTKPDDMTAPYHWLSCDRINWLIAEMKLYLGWA